MSVDRTKLLQDLRTAGVSSGDVVIVHSSLKSIGRVDGGAATVIAAWIDAVGPAGTILMPTFSFPQPDGLFHVAATPSRTGAITEAFRTTPGVVRSLHPTHSIAAWGARARELTEGHERTSGLGVNSPLHKAADAGAKCLMVGCDFRAASVVHVAEVIQQVPYLGRVWFSGSYATVTLVTPDGRRIEIPPKVLPACSWEFTKVQARLDRIGRLKQARVGDAVTLVYQAGDALAEAVLMLKADPGALLCDRPDCEVCPKAKQLLGGSG